ncbi:glycosyltransferase family 2 protein [Thalassobium sp. R2A62]|uniref:glycosyltransferase family 2 protein n=1 Tax=Thalassobium sp. R2A62 TaxID=633131 RepID=UPI0001B1D754|nr:glycosyltransferase family A protein [Thalassobium sp. R2A62]EET48734.1 glycosyltransferase [Thalassobium sp. R2A62]
MDNKGLSGAINRKVAIVVATLGRDREVGRLLESLESQSFQNFEVIIVDQNNDRRLKGEIDKYRDRLTIQHISVPEIRGLSRARNIGWRACSAEIYLFADDDCWYPSDFLEKALKAFAREQPHILSGRAADETERSINGRFLDNSTWVDAETVWITQIEWVVFVRREVLQAIDGYDESLGVGELDGSCEGPDLSLRAFESGFNQFYDPDIFGHHLEILVSDPTKADFAKAYLYGRGMGAVLRKHKYGTLSLLNWILRPVAKAVLSLLCLRPRFALLALYTAIGRLRGYFRW